MAQELLLINPRSRRKRTTRRRSSTSRRRRTYARRNPTRRRRAAPLARSTPVRRSRRRRSSGRLRRYTSRARAGYSRFRASNIGNFVTDKIVPASVGAFGALGVDLLWGYLPIPDTMKSGMLAPVTRIGGAILIGYAVGAVAGKRIGQEAMAGAVIVTLYDLFKTTLKANTSLPLSGLGYISPGTIVGGPRDWRELEYNADIIGPPSGLSGMGMYVGEDDDPDIFDYGVGGGEFTGRDDERRYG